MNLNNFFPSISQLPYPAAYARILEIRKARLYVKPRIERKVKKASKKVSTKIKSDLTKMSKEQLLNLLERIDEQL